MARLPPGLPLERPEPQGSALLPRIPAAVHAPGRLGAGTLAALRRHPRGAGRRVADALRLRLGPAGRAHPPLGRAALAGAHHRRRARGAWIEAGFRAALGGETGPWRAPSDIVGTSTRVSLGTLGTFWAALR